MGWFHASGRVEIIYVSWPFITWWSKEGQVDWRIKLHKLYAFKENTKKQALCWYYIQTKKVYHSSLIYGCQPYNCRSIHSESQKQPKQGSWPAEWNEGITLKTDIGKNYQTGNTKNHTHHWQ